MFVFGYRTVEKYKKNHTRAYVHLAPGTFEIQRNLPKNTRKFCRISILQLLKKIVTVKIF